MAGSLTRIITSPSQAGYGVNLLEKSAPLTVAEAGTSVVGIVGHFPWGPEDEIIEVGSVGEALEAVAPDVFAQSKDTTAFPALLALPLPWPSGIRLVRVSGAGAAKATITIDTDKMTVTAKYKGSAGNGISVEVKAASNGEGTARDIVIRIGTAYAATYTNRAAGELATISDPYVDIAETALPDVTAATDLANGADGVPVAGDYVPGEGTDEGARLFEADDSDVSVVFCAGVGSALVAAVNTALKTFLASVGKGIYGVFSTPVGATASAIQTTVATLRTDRGTLPWPRVKVQDVYQDSLPTVTVDGNADAALAIASVAPERSPGGAQGAPYLERILALETSAPSRATLDAMKAAGVAAFYRSRTLGTILRGGVTTSNDPRLVSIFRRRMTDFIAFSLAEAMERYAELPADYTVSNGQVSLGPITTAQTGIVIDFLQGLENAGRISGYAVETTTGNTKAAKALGQFTINVAVELNGIQDAIIIAHTSGPGVSV